MLLDITRRIWQYGTAGVYNSSRRDIPIELRDSSSLNASVCKPHFIEIDFRNMALVWEI